MFQMRLRVLLYFLSWDFLDIIFIASLIYFTEFHILAKSAATMVMQEPVFHQEIQSSLLPHDKVLPTVRHKGKVITGHLRKNLYDSIRNEVQKKYWIWKKYRKDKTKYQKVEKYSKLKNISNRRQNLFIKCQL